MMNASKHEEVTEQLHEMWENVEENCKAQEHIGRIQYGLNYAHVQVVTVCAHCYEWGRRQHVNLYNHLTGEKVKLEK